MVIVIYRVPPQYPKGYPLAASPNKHASPETNPLLRRYPAPLNPPVSSSHTAVTINFPLRSTPASSKA